MRNLYECTKEECINCFEQLSEVQDQLSLAVADLDSKTEIWNSSLEAQFELLSKQKDYEVLIDKIRDDMSGYGEVSPEMAIEKLIIENESLYVYQMRSYSQKKKLLECALSSADYSCIIHIILYLEYTLIPRLFEKLILGNSEAVRYYLRYLKHTDKQKFKNICLETHAYREFGLFMYAEAIKVDNIKTQLKQLEKCLSFFKEHPVELGSHIDMVEESLQNAKIGAEFTLV
eukprot:TRINITY_DN4894_c0_g1_i2.p1 TRINITY_DN4894_c0_g1~~TRINITY_DN4894_c0_g1_i2.p1  ORF type:complete len:231 (-),score=31.16 TRINITY_DN4894_c0_g1_i2:16-708(-)